MSDETFPDFIGIGVPKCGTTWLARCLQQHPEIFLHPIKELDFFGWDFDPEKLHVYTGEFADASAYKVRGEYTTTYFADPNAASRIAQYVPDAKLILALRNPVDQIYSFYWHSRRQSVGGAGPPMSFDEAVRQEYPPIFSGARYSSHLERWLQHFDRSQFHIFLYDDLAKSPLTCVQSVYRFLGVDDTFTPPSLNQRSIATRKGVSPRSPLADTMYATVYTFLNRTFYQPLKSAIGWRRAARIQQNLGVGVLLQKIFMKEGYPALTDAQRQTVYARVADDVEQLERLLDLDLSQWKP